MTNRAFVADVNLIPFGVPRTYLSSIMTNSQVTRRENAVEAAIEHALTAYFCKKEGKINTFRPYANQQNSKELDEYCSDLIHVLDDCSLLLLEVKELDKATLHEFKPNQHQRMIECAEWLPIHYAYNKIHRLKLPNLAQAPGWIENTMQAILVSTPSDLPDATPASHSHANLLELVRSLLGESGTSESIRRQDRFKTFGQLLDDTIIPEILTNWFLILVYKGDELFYLTGEDLIKVYKRLLDMAKRPGHTELAAALQRLKDNPFRHDPLSALAAAPDDQDSTTNDENDNDNGRVTPKHRKKGFF